MKRILVLSGLCFALSSQARPESGDLLSSPLLVVQPSSINFGVVPARTTLTNTFLIENAGAGRLVGRASVALPFKIVDGASYSLGPNEAQVVTITYTPDKTGHDRRTVRFTGGHGARAVVSGRRADAEPAAP